MTHMIKPKYTLEQNSKAEGSSFSIQQRAFTLIEIILAVSIAGALLSAAASLVVSVSELWAERQDKHFFDDHVDGVTEFIQASLIQAGTVITLNASEQQAANNSSSTDFNTNTSNPNTTGVKTISSDKDKNVRENKSQFEGASLIKTAEQPITWSKPPGYADYEDPLLHYSLKDSSPLFIKEDDAPIIGIEAFLYFEKNKGLSILWYTPLQEDSEDLNDLRRTQISDLITKIEFIYWDDRFEKWEIEIEPKESEKNGELILPRFTKLTFEYQGESKERIITIPVPSQYVLIF